MTSVLLIKKPQLINSVCLHTLGPLCVLFWWRWCALCLFSPPHPPQLLHLFQLAGVQGGAPRSIKPAQSCRCTYSTAHSWHTGVTLWLFGGHTVTHRRECGTVIVSYWEHLRMIQTQAYNHTCISNPPSPTYHTSTLHLTPSHTDWTSLLHQCVCCAWRVCLC